MCTLNPSLRRENARVLMISSGAGLPSVSSTVRLSSSSHMSTACRLGLILIENKMNLYLSNLAKVYIRFDPTVLKFSYFLELQNYVSLHY